MTEIRITGLTVSESAGDRELRIRARFDAIVGPLRIKGCQLKLTDDGRLRAVMPRCKNASSSIRFADDEDHGRLTRAAVAACNALGGVLPADEP